METIHDKSLRTNLPRVSLDWVPKSTSFTILAGGNVYPWTLNEPPPGPSPDQPDIFTTTTNVALTFTASVVTDPGDFIVEYYWDFGDGVEGYGPSVVHTYRSASAQTRVSLCVTDNHRRQVCIGQQIQLVAGQPVVAHQAIVVV